jgi:hypothetical protein
LHDTAIGPGDSPRDISSAKTPHGIKQAASKL